MKKYKCWVLCLLASCVCLIFAACSSLPAKEPSNATLTVHVDTGTTTYNRADLLHRPELQTIVVEADAAYHAQRIYQAIPLRSLLPALNNTGSLQFTALDGFVANIPASFFQGAAEAWLAVESPVQTWPKLKDSEHSAGPFYLVWIHPEQAHISAEQWPYQIASIAQTVPLEVRYPQLLPNAVGDSQAVALRGLQVFAKNCAACHSLNGGGDAKVGPDLNLPFNPTEYFQENYLRRLIRGPASVRSWKQSQMPGFSVENISEQELSDLLVYLRQMAAQRRA